MKEYRLNILCLFFVTLISFAFYSELIFFEKTYYFRDLSTILLPLQKTVLNLLKDSFPLWNPYQVLGKPLFADPLSGLQYPPNIIFYLLKQPYTYNLSIVFHHIAAAFGFYLLLRKLDFSFESSVISGFLFSFSGIMVSQDNMINALQSSSWAPYVLCYFVLVLKERRRVDFFKLVIFYSLCFLGGMPEICIYLNFFFLFIVFYYTNKELTSFKESFIYIIKANLFLLGLSAFFLIPFIEYISNSTRNSGLTENLIINFSHNPINTLGFFIPRFLIDQNGLFKESSSFFNGFYKNVPWAISIYVGLSLLFIFPAIYFAKRKDITFFSLIFLLFLLLSFGGFIPYYGEIISNLPILNLSRYPEKYLYCVSGLLVFSIAFGIDSFFKQRNKTTYFFLILFLIFSFELYFVNLKQIPSISFKEYEVKPLLLNKIKNKDNLTRIYNNEFRELTTIKKDKEIFEVKKSMLMHVISNQYNLSNLNSPASLNLSSHEKVISKIGSGTKDEIINHLKNLSVNYITSQNKLTNYIDLTEEFYDKAKGVYLYKLNNSKPRAYISNQKERVKFINYKANRVELEVDLKKPGRLILNDTYYPGWNVLVNGKKDNIYNINGVRGVFLKKGKSEVVFNFFPKSVLIGVMISILSFLLLLKSIIK